MWPFLIQFNDDEDDAQTPDYYQDSASYLDPEEVNGSVLPGTHYENRLCNVLSVALYSVFDE